MHEDTISLLGDCTAGIEMALSTLDGLAPSVEDPLMRKKLQESAATHRALQAQAVARLHSLGGTEKSPPSLALGMAWLKVNGTMALHRDDPTAAELICNGCDMGVRSLSRSRNRYAGADAGAISLAQELIRCEERLSAGLRPYL